MDDKIKTKVLHLLEYGLYIFTTRRGDEVNGFTCNWLTQASFEPPLLVMCVEKESHSHEMLKESGVFAINFIAKDQTKLINHFTKPHSVNPKKLQETPYHTEKTGCPILDDAVAFLECEVKNSLDAGGDHEIFVGEIVEAGLLNKEVQPIIMRDTKLSYAG